MACPISELIKNEREIDWASAAGVGERRSRRVGMRDDSAPVEETEPISSWLKRAMTFTLPSRVGKD